MQSFILDRHTDPNNPTMKVTQDDKIPVYDSLADAQADIANIEEGQIGMTEDSGATEKVVDVIQDGNMNAVTSNAVFDAIKNIHNVNFIPSSTYTEGNIRYVKQGNTITMMGWVYAPSPVSGGRVKLADVPSVLFSIALLSSQNTSTGNGIPSVEIENSELSIYMANSGDAGYIRFSGSYITSEN